MHDVQIAVGTAPVGIQVGSSPVQISPQAAPGKSAPYYLRRSMCVQGTFRALWITGGLLKLLDMTRMSATFPAGITIHSWYMDSFALDPNPELDADLCSCTSPGNGAMPGAGVAVLATLDTNQGNSKGENLNIVVPAGKVIYLRINADPVVAATIWSLVINYTSNAA